MTTAWYYDYYEKGSFPHQQELCDAVMFIKGCNLEGQQLVCPNHLTGIATNPLTLRLRALKSALKLLKDSVNNFNKKNKNNLERYFRKNEHAAISTTLHTQHSHMKTGGAAIEEVNFPGEETFTFRYDTVHFALFDYFSSFISILDRLAFEINRLYKLGDWTGNQLDWNRITNSNEEFFCCLQTKDHNLADFIKNQRPNFKDIPSYRNRIIHDGIIRILVKREGVLHNLQIFLPKDPKIQETSYDKNVIEVCEEAKAKVLKLLDESYRLMLQHIKTNGKPPW